VAAKAGIVRYRPALDKHVGFRRNKAHIAGTARGRRECGVTLAGGFDRVSMHLVAIDATYSIGRVRATGPVPGVFILRMAAQAYSVGLGRGSMLEGDDLRNVSSAIDVKAAIAMTILALDALLGMKGVLEVLRQIGVAGRAHIRADWFCTRNLLVPLELRVAVYGAVHR
jgi:hypothetical protein